MIENDNEFQARFAMAERIPTPEIDAAFMIAPERNYLVKVDPVPQPQIELLEMEQDYFYRLLPTPMIIGKEDLVVDYYRQLRDYLKTQPEELTRGMFFCVIPALYSEEIGGRYIPGRPTVAGTIALLTKIAETTGEIYFDIDQGSEEQIVVTDSEIHIYFGNPDDDEVYLNVRFSRQGVREMAYEAISRLAAMIARLNKEMDWEKLAKR